MFSLKTPLSDSPDIKGMNVQSLKFKLLQFVHELKDDDNKREFLLMSNENKIQFLNKAKNIINIIHHKKGFTRKEKCEWELKIDNLIHKYEILE